MEKLIFTPLLIKKSYIYSIVLLALLLNSCTLFQTKTHDTTGDAAVQLTINSLHAKQVQEKGLLDSDTGDELALLYTINAYNKEGQLTSVNNGLWGIRQTKQNALILADQFDKIDIPAYRDGRLLIAVSLIEIDDFKGERKMDKVRDYTKSVRFPKLLRVSAFDEDKNLPPLELIDRSFKIAGYKYFKTKQMDVSTNDDLGGTKQAFDAAELNNIINGSKTIKETYEIDGANVNEPYLYIVKYGIQLKKSAK
ncbi:hypothetical protein Q0590_14255 [Rhodocytophaga aerolata]|uniref:Uncharacterized protein n=1 Tax=Rhodocytophaga aerolata TaxID=455078 RepID=A0ABT8R5R9_9BACT|nr:hypothetical protein [Rhodocytophaga aerolata]MDO1447427.1 hypothetical protein [Rhodocytophaga aerolata]